MNIETRWNKKASSILLGKTITLVRYMNGHEQEDMGWYNKAVVMHLNDGTVLFPTQDDEGNGPGALDTTYGILPIIPVI